MENVLKQVTAHPSFIKKPLGIKLAPYFDIPHFEKVAAMIKKFPMIKFVTTINTIGNALWVDGENEMAMIAPKGGFGGLGGGLVKSTALANVRKLVINHIETQVSYNIFT